MSDMMSALSSAIDVLKQKVTTHKTDAATVADLAALTSLEGTHTAEALVVVVDLEHQMADLQTCKGSKGELPPLGTMVPTVAAAKSECDAHRAKISAAPDLAAARAEETRYQEAMEKHVMALHGGHHGMSAMAGSYTCTSASHSTTGGHGH
ncbi:MAG: hypothetical protein IT371_00620 [Deltaproteobacteria bacterium]|nr:hypothetical protein [Deltaproteobacteria bacterium]